MTQKIEKIIVKYLTNSASAADLDTLSNWIENPANKQIFEDSVQTHYAINCIMNNADSEKTIEQLLLTIRKEKSFVHRLKTNAVFKYAAAASVILIVALTIFLNKGDNTPGFVEPIIVNNQIEAGTDKATLTLEDGSVVTLEKGNTYQTQNASSNGEQIVYVAGERNSTEIAYNYLTIPRGGQFFIELSDGTQVWLNSESQLKYPVSFKEGEVRQVELVYGEAYFDVSPSTEHGGSKFKVFNQSQEVEVLGTEFNIKAYKDEINIYTTLVEGKVSVNLANTSHLLKPAQQANLNIYDNTMTIETVDLYNETSWKDGVFSFRRKPLVEIMKVLSRWYDMDVNFVNSELGKTGFNGVLGKEQNIEDILKTIKSFGVIKGYEINNKTIYLK